MTTEAELIPRLIQTAPAFGKYLGERIEELGDPEEGNSYRGLFNLARFCVDRIAAPDHSFLAVVASELESLYGTSDSEATKALNTAFLEELWYECRDENVDLAPLLALLGPRTRHWWDKTASYLGGSGK